MARLPRFVLPGEPQHIIQRGNNRNTIFNVESDYSFYLEKLTESCEGYACSLHAYVLMTNHVHLLMTPEEKDRISKVMQSLGRVYVQYFNYRYRRTGTLWEGRYKSTLLDSDRYLLTCYRYIELDPVRAGMAEHPAEYRWSNYRCNALGEPNMLVTPHRLYQSLGKNEESCCEQYRGLFDDQIPALTLVEIREATNKAWILGNKRFRERSEVLLERQASPKKRGGDRKSAQFRERRSINRV